MLPSLNGIHYARQLRAEERTRNLLVIMLAPPNVAHDKFDILEIGADDYLNKPFGSRDLLTMIKTVLRQRAPQMTEESVEVERLRVDPITHRISCNGQALELGTILFRLLHYFMTHAERVHSRRQ